MLIKVRSCLFLVLLFIGVIIGVYLFWGYEAPVDGLGRYRSARRRYEETGVSLDRVRRAYDLLDYGERRKLERGERGR